MRTRKTGRKRGKTKRQRTDRAHDFDVDCALCF